MSRRRIVAGMVAAQSNTRHPIDIFRRNSAPGYLLDFNQLGTLWQDTAKTVPANIGDPVGCVQSLVNGVEFIQETTTKRAILCGMPVTGIRNILNNNSSETYTANLASRGGATLTTTQNVEINGMMGSRVVSSGGTITTKGSTGVTLTGVPQGTKFTVRCYARTQGDYGAGIATGHGYMPIPANSEGWFEQTFTMGSNGILDNGVRVNGEDVSHTIDLTIACMQIEIGEVATPYQHVISPYYVTERGVRNINYLTADGIDDAYVSREELDPLGSYQVTCAGAIQTGSGGGSAHLIFEHGETSLTTAGTFRLFSPSASYDHVYGSNAGSLAEVAIDVTDDTQIQTYLDYSNIIEPIVRSKVNGIADTNTSTQGIEEEEYLPQLHYLYARNQAESYMMGNAFGHLCIFRELSPWEEAFIQDWYSNLRISSRTIEVQ